jgi:hypothetical protein
MRLENDAKRLENEAKRLALQEKEGQNTRDFMLQMLANMQQQQQP